MSWISRCSWVVDLHLHLLWFHSFFLQLFRDQAIDGEILPVLTEDHLLQNMGMKLGPALKIRLHIAKRLGFTLNGQYCTLKTPYEEVHWHADEPSAWTHNELKLCKMICDFEYLWSIYFGEPFFHHQRVTTEIGLADLYILDFSKQKCPWTCSIRILQCCFL